VGLLVRRVITPLLLLLVLAAAVVALSGCGSSQVLDSPGSKERQPSQRVQTQQVPVEGGGSYTNVDAGGLAKMLKRKDFLLVNVHVPYEGEIAQTDRFIPYDRIGSNLDRLTAAKDAKVVLYRRSGSMSAVAAREVVSSGYTSVWNLDGGMIGWQDAGYHLIKRKQ